MKTHRLAFLLAVFFATMPLARAASLEGVTMPDTITVNGKTLVLNGLGLREATIFRINVYVAGLYLEKKSHDAQQILSSTGTKRLVMQFVRHVSRSDLVDAWNDDFPKNAGGKMAAIEPGLKMLNSWMYDVKKGDTWVFTFEPNQTTAQIKGKNVGAISGADFGRVMLRIFIGPKPPNEGLRDGLLGKK